MSTQPVHEVENEEEDLAPPEEQFWQRYSPRHEFSLSASSSIVLHALVVAAAVAIGYYMVNALDAQSSPLPVGAIMIEGGGGGDPQGTKGGNGGIAKVEDIGMGKEKSTPLPKTVSTGLVTPSANPIDVKEPDPTDDKLIAEARLATRSLQDTRQKIIDSLPDLGRGGTGTGGGKGKGKGTGNGDMEGPGSDPVTRLGRSMRWHLNLQADDARDCLRQMAELGIILAVREPDGRYRVFRNLAQQPLQGQLEEPRDIKRLPIVDQNPQSVAFLAQALGLPYRPHHVFAFLPPELEAKLVKTETDFRGMNEKNIKVTVFRIARENGRLTPSVIEQQ